MVAISAVAYYGYPAKKLTVIGVTGTDGKTTTSTMIAHILKSADKKVGLVGTLGAYINGDHREIGLHVTTPNPFSLQKLLKEMVENKCEYAVIEATSQGLDQNRLLGCNISYALLTNITHEHLDYHKDFDRYTAAKAKLFRKVRKSVLNADGPWINAIRKYQLGGDVITYNMPDSLPLPFSLKIIGDFNKQNALGAMAITQELGIERDVIRNTLNNFKGIEGRMEEINKGQKFRVIVDFAHTPFATEQALSTLRVYTKNKLISVLGSAGLRDTTKRPMLGKISGKLADVTILTSDDPATEDVNAIINEMSLGCRKAKVREVNVTDFRKESLKNHVFLKIPDRASAIQFAISIAEKGDTVALLGKGHQKSLTIGRKEIPWNEKKVAIKALASLHLTT